MSGRLATAFSCSHAIRLAVGALLPGILLGAIVGSAARAEPKSDEGFAPTTAITLPNGQMISKFDISFVDPVLELYLLADRSNKAIDVIDTGSNTLSMQLLGTGPNGTFQGFTGSNDTSGPNGVLTVSHQEVWAGDGNSTVKVIDLASQQTTHVVSTGGVNRADELCWDPRDHLVLIANDADSPPFVSFISTDTYTVVGRIAFDGGHAPKATNGIEQCQWSRRTGMFYLAIPEVNGAGNDTSPGAVAVISPTTMSVAETFTLPLGVCAGPQGMALGPENQILLGCNDPNKTVPSTVAINQHSGAVMRVLSGEDGADQVWFNDGDDHYFLARSGGANPQQLGVVDAQSGHEDASVATGLPNTSTTPHGTNHSVAADPIQNQVYVPIASNAGLAICSTLGGSDAQGCIAVMTTANDDRHRHHGGDK
jgi:hypothetical protein